LVRYDDTGKVTLTPQKRIVIKTNLGNVLFQLNIKPGTISLIDIGVQKWLHEANAHLDTALELSRNNDNYFLPSILFARTDIHQLMSNLTYIIEELEYGLENAIFTGADIDQANYFIVLALSNQMSEVEGDDAEVEKCINKYLPYIRKILEAITMQQGSSTEVNSFLGTRLGNIFLTIGQFFYASNDIDSALHIYDFLEKSDSNSPAFMWYINDGKRQCHHKTGITTAEREAMEAQTRELRRVPGNDSYTKVMLHALNQSLAPQPSTDSKATASKEVDTSTSAETVEVDSMALMRTVMGKLMSYKHVSPMQAEGPKPKPQPLKEIYKARRRYIEGNFVSKIKTNGAATRYIFWDSERINKTDIDDDTITAMQRSVADNNNIKYDPKTKMLKVRQLKSGGSHHRLWFRKAGVVPEDTPSKIANNYYVFSHATYT